MKTALVLSGHVRGFAHAFKTWAWMMQVVDGTFFQCIPPTPGEVKIEDLIPNAIGEYAEDDPEIPELVQGSTPVHRSNPMPPNLYSPRMWRQRQLAYKKVTQEFDTIIHCRTDLHFLQTNVVLRTHSICVPIKFSWGGICDQWAYGPRDLMAHYFLMYEHGRDWEGDAFPPWTGNNETRLERHLTGIPICRTFLAFVRVRGDGTLRDSGDPYEGAF